MPPTLESILGLSEASCDAYMQYNSFDMRDHWMGGDGLFCPCGTYGFIIKLLPHLPPFIAVSDKYLLFLNCKCSSCYS